MNRYLPAFAFLAVAAVGAAMTVVVYRAEDVSTRLNFERVADKAVGRIDDRITRYLTLLQATNAFFTARDGVVTKAEMRDFVTALDLKNRFGGLLGLGLAKLIDAGAETRIEDELSDRYGGERPVWPETRVKRRTPIVLLEPLDRANEAALGYDMFSEPVRRAAMQRALDTGSGAASGPVDLVGPSRRPSKALSTRLSLPRTFIAKLLSAPPTCRLSLRPATRPTATIRCCSNQIISRKFPRQAASR